MKFTARRRPSPAMVVAVVALSLGLVGSAAAGSGLLGKAQVKKVANTQITKRAPGLTVASAKAADTARTADAAKTADTAKTASSATTATTANNATKLDGVAADGYQRACEPGAIKGSVVIDTTSLNTQYTAVPGFNCTGGSVEVRKAGNLATGQYLVRFAGNPGAATAVVSTTSNGADLPGNSIVASVSRIPDSTIGNEQVFEVKTYEISGPSPNGGSGLESNTKFTLLAY